MQTQGEFDAWIGECSRADLAEPFTFVVGVDGVLRLAPRRSEHVVCAGGEPLLSAGEVAFERASDGWFVAYVSNQSTGYCPDGQSWPAVAFALDQIGLVRPDGFTAVFEFRRCPDCAALNVVRDAVFACAVCDADLPQQWNVDLLGTS